ncbi:hypothetical protein EV715DRAFT_248019, partial [Schizophyllum commune]
MANEGLGLGVHVGTKSTITVADHAYQSRNAPGPQSAPLSPITNTVIPNSLPAGSSRMRDLESAALGGTMVKIDKYGGSGFLTGDSIDTNCITPNGGTVSRAFELDMVQSSLARNDTVLAPGAPAKELKSLLGKGDGARLKSGAAINREEDRVALEHAKSKARVELDLVLENNVCVQGGTIAGHLCVHVRKRTKHEGDIMISRGKLRLVGFETLGGQHDRHVFYQTAVSMSDASERSDAVLDSQEDLDGFAWAKTGDHIIPFAMQVPLEGDVGNAKGVLDAQSGGASVRYIIMITVKVRDPATDARSIAHFYRDCEVWPRLNPSAILAPAPRPISDTNAKALFMGGSGKVYLTAQLHRVHWIAGQQCYVRIVVNNGSKKTMKRLNITLVRTLVAYKPNSKKDEDDDPDACSATTYEKQVAETSLEMCESGSRGHASAKGWWTGVMPDEDKEFSHFIQIPPDALTIPRGRLLEVEYTLRVSISSGGLSSDLTVKVPLRIINFLSVDPPPSVPTETAPMSRGSTTASGPMLAYDRDDSYGPSRPGSRNGNYAQGGGEAEIPAPQRGIHSRPALPGMFQLSSLPESDEHLRTPVAQASRTFPSNAPSSQTDGYSDEYADPDSSGYIDEDGSLPPIGLANLSMRDDSDDVVQYAVSSASQDYSNQTDNGSLETSTIQTESEVDAPVPYTRQKTCAPSAVTFSDLYY